MIKPYDLSHEPRRNGPITRIQNGRGLRPWLEEVIVEPGYAYLVTKSMTSSTPQGPTRRVCWRCVHAVMEHFDAHAELRYEEEPPKPGERCPRCERGFGERPAPVISDPSAE